MEGIGLHAIKAKQRVKEELALGQNTKHPKFAYQKEISEHFNRDENRYKSSEKKLFD